MSLAKADEWRARRVGLEAALEIAEMRERECLGEEVALRAPAGPGESVRLDRWSGYSGKPRPPLYYRVDEVQGFRHTENGTVGVLLCREYVPGSDILGSRIVLLPENQWGFLTKEVPFIPAMNKRRRQ